MTARIDDKELGCPRLKTTAMTMKQGLLASSSSIGRTRRFWRFFWTRRKGEGCPVAAVALVGATTTFSGGCEERTREGEEHGERVRGPGGCVAVSVAVEGPRGREAGREEATASPSLTTELLRGEGRKTTGGGGLGRAGPVLLGHQVSGPGEYCSF